MAEIMYPNIVGGFQQAQQMGRENRLQDEALARRSQLGQLASQAYGTRGDERAGLVRQAIATDPAAGFELEDSLQGLEDAGQKRLIQSARFLMAAPEEQREGIYQQLKPQLSQLGLQLPQNYDQTVADTATALASAYGPSSNFSDRYKVVGNSLIDLQNPTQAAYTAPDAPRYIEGDNGVFVATPEGLRRLDVTGQGAPAQAGAVLAPDRDFAALGRKFGLSPTSVARTPERNREVGGVANSYHIGGNASDWAVPAAQKPEFMAQARAMGYEAIDEGDHIHVEPRSRDQLSGGGGQGGGFVPRGAGRQAAADRRADEHLRLAQETSARADREEARRTEAQRVAASGGGLSAGELKKVRDDYKGIQDVEGDFRALESALADVGPMEALLPAGQGRLGTAYNNARAGLRILYNTGVLQPGELPMLEAALRDPSSWRGIVDPRTRSQLAAQLNELHGLAARRRTALEETYPSVFNRGQQGGQGGGQPARPTTEAQYNALPSGALFVDPDDGRTYRKP